MNFHLTIKTKAAKKDNQLKNDVSQNDAIQKIHKTLNARYAIRETICTTNYQMILQKTYSKTTGITNTYVTYQLINTLARLSQKAIIPIEPFTPISKQSHGSKFNILASTG